MTNNCFVCEFENAPDSCKDCKECLKGGDGFKFAKSIRSFNYDKHYSNVKITLNISKESFIKISEFAAKEKKSFTSALETIVNER